MRRGVVEGDWQEGDCRRGRGGGGGSPGGREGRGARRRGPPVIIICIKALSCLSPGTVTKSEDLERIQEQGEGLSIVRKRGRRSEVKGRKEMGGRRQ